jgi:hypothetical protein
VRISNFHRSPFFGTIYEDVTMTIKLPLMSRLHFGKRSGILSSGLTGGENIVAAAMATTDVDGEPASTQTGRQQETRAAGPGAPVTAARRKIARPWSANQASDRDVEQTPSNLG